MISFDKINLDISELNQKYDCVIHSNVIIDINTDKNYIINIDKNYKNCIGTSGGTSTNYRYDAKELLNECSNFGKVLYELYKNDFKLYSPSILQVDDEEIEFFSVKQKNFPDIKDNKINELLSIFIDWINKYGFPTTPKILGIEENTILEFKEILHLRDKFLILFLLYRFYSNLNSICNQPSTYGISESTRYQLQSSIKEVNNLGIILFPKFEKLENDFIEKELRDRLNYFNEIKIKLIDKINYYSSVFKIHVLQHLLYDEEECRIVYISDNLFDLSWNTFINIFKYSKKIINVKLCKECGCSYFVAGNHSLRCGNCKKEYNSSKKYQEEKNEIIDYIIRNTDTITITDNDLKQKIDEIKSLTQKGNSRKKYKFNKSCLKEVKKKLNILLKNQNLKE